MVLGELFSFGLLNQNRCLFFEKEYCGVVQVDGIIVRLDGMNEAPARSRSLSWRTFVLPGGDGSIEYIKT